MVDRLCSPSKCDSVRLRSQYWVTRGSGIRASAAVEGAARSVTNTGSQTIKTRMSLPVFSRSNCPVAEAPCKQTAQVGESMTRIRVELAEALNAVFKGVRSPEEKLRSGGRRLGVQLPPRKQDATPSAAAASPT